MNARLFFKAIIKMLIGLLILAALLFVPAGTLKYKIVKVEKPATSKSAKSAKSAVKPAPKTADKEEKSTKTAAKKKASK